jgi:RHS repeat-associated protein
VTETKLNYTGQKKDDTGLLYYHARMYDPALGRFVSPDSIVPVEASTTPSGVMQAGQESYTGLTVDVHETVYLGAQNALYSSILRDGFLFHQDSNDHHQAPMDPQTLNRFAYVLNNPIGSVDPSGHKTLKRTVHAICSTYQCGRPQPAPTRGSIDPTQLMNTLFGMPGKEVWRGVTITGPVNNIVTNVESNALRGLSNKVLNSAQGRSKAEAVLDDLLRGNDSSLKALKNFKDVLELSRGDVRVYLRRIKDFEGKPTYEIIGMSFKDAQDEALRALTAAGY